MAFLRNKTLLSITLFLAVVLQGLIPFLHAHTGASTQIGLHMHVSSVGFESLSANHMAVTSTTSGESPEVGVPASRQNEQFNFDLPDLFALVLLIIPFLVVFLTRHHLNLGFGFLKRHYQTQNSPPPALAPPYSL